MNKFADSSLKFFTKTSRILKRASSDVPILSSVLFISSHILLVNQILYASLDLRRLSLEQSNHFCNLVNKIRMFHSSVLIRLHHLYNSTINYKTSFFIQCVCNLTLFDCLFARFLLSDNSCWHKFNKQTWIGPL